MPNNIEKTGLPHESQEPLTLSKKTYVMGSFLETSVLFAVLPAAYARRQACEASCRAHKGEHGENPSTASVGCLPVTFRARINLIRVGKPYTYIKETNGGVSVYVYQR